MDSTRTNCRGNKQSRSQNQDRLTSETVAQLAGTQSTDQTADQRAAHSPALEDRITCYLEILFIKRLCTAYHNPVVTKEETSHGRDQGDQKQIKIRLCLHGHNDID